MKNSSQTILLIESSVDKINTLSEILIEQNYFVDSEKDAEVGIQKAISGSCDLIICQNEMEGYSGFHIYKTLENHLMTNGIPFFLCLDKYVEDDILIGLEMGIDNFLVYPIDKTVLEHKVKNHLRKTKELSFLEANKFNVFFETSPVAMFTTYNNKIDLVNSSYRKLFNVTKEIQQNLLISEIINLSEDKLNLLNFRKLINGLFQQCCLKEVSVLNNSSSLFDINICHISNIENGKMLAVVIPSKINGNGGMSNGEYKMQNHNLSGGEFSEDGEKHTIKLTFREKEVLELSAQGIPIKQIASILNLSDRTVEKHRSNIMGKLNATNIIEAIAIAQRNHLLVCCPSLD